MHGGTRSVSLAAHKARKNMEIDGPASPTSHWTLAPPENAVPASPRGAKQLFRACQKKNTPCQLYQTYYFVEKNAAGFIPELSAGLSATIHFNFNFNFNF
jgi:hypothetical protein